MQSTYGIRRAGGAVLPALMLCLAATAMAKEPAAGLAGEPKTGVHDPATPPRLPGAKPTDGAIVPASPLPTKLSDYWLGIECYPVPPALHAQLNLPKEQGLLVENVVPDSPAAKAGVKPFDILMKVGDKPFKTPGELIQAVDASKDKEMAIDLLRGGKPVTVKAKPARRPEGDVAMPHTPGAGDADWDTLRKWLDETRQHLGQRFQRGAEGDMPPLRFRFFHPGAILPPGAPLPANTSVSVTKKGNEPAKVAVTRDNEKWEVTENELDKLPADLRPYVEQMLGRITLGFNFRGDRVGVDLTPTKPGEPRRPEAEKAPREGAPEQPGVAAERRMERQIDLMNRRIEQLQKSINEMRDRLPKQVEERMERMQKSFEERRDRAREKASPKPREEKPSEPKGI